MNFTSSETRRIVIPDAENSHDRIFLRLDTIHNVTDIQTDRETDRNGLASTAVCIARNADAL